MSLLLLLLLLERVGIAEDHPALAPRALLGCPAEAERGTDAARGCLLLASRDQLGHCASHSAVARLAQTGAVRRCCRHAATARLVGVFRSFAITGRRGSSRVELVAQHSSSLSAAARLAGRRCKPQRQLTSHAIAGAWLMPCLCTARGGGATARLSFITHNRLRLSLHSSSQ